MLIKKSMRPKVSARLLNHGGHLLLHAAIGLAGQHLHAVEPLQLLLGVVQLLGVPAGDDQIAALLGEGGGQAVADAAALAAAGDIATLPSNLPISSPP